MTFPHPDDLVRTYLGEVQIEVERIHRLYPRNVGGRGLWARLEIGNASPLAILRGEGPLPPIRGSVLRAGPPIDLVGTTWAMLLLVSMRFREALQRLGLTGWSTRPIARDARLPEDLELLVVTGRCGPAFSASRNPLPGLPRLGTFIDAGNWDGADMFVADGSGEVLVAPSRVDAVKHASLRNVELRPAGLEALAVLNGLDDAAPGFIWGDTVTVSASAPQQMGPGEVGRIVAVTRRGSETTYTVEFADGTDAEGAGLVPVT